MIKTLSIVVTEFLLGGHLVPKAVRVRSASALGLRFQLQAGFLIFYFET